MATTASRTHEPAHRSEPAPAPHAAAPWANLPEVQALIAEMRQRNPDADPMSLLPEVDPRKIPRHIAVIMDGNGRWAQQRGLSRIFGHQQGAKGVRTIVSACGKLGVECLTLYSFSLENWKRPADEIAGLMDLYTTYLQAEADEIVRNNIRFVQIGRREGLPPEVLRAVDQLTERTRANTGAKLCLAVNYGSRAEIVDAVRTIAAKVARGDLTTDQISDQTISDHLYTAGLPDPDLLIRTAGEMRVSNYLLWQISYAELHVTDVLWPDFGIPELHEAVREYARRSRRFGGLNAI